MRICDLNTLYLDGGAGGVNTYLHEKARFLAGLEGIEHVVVFPAEESGRRRLFGSTVHAVRSPRLPGSPHRVLVDVRRIGRILREADPDIVEVDSTYLLGRMAARALAGRRARLIGFHHSHLPFLVTCLGVRAGTVPGRILERLAWRYLVACARPLARLVVPSLDIFHRLKARGFDRLAHVPLGVNLDLFRPRAPAAPGPQLTVLYVGRLSEEKDLRLLFRAFGLLAARRSDVRLVVAGDGPLRPLAEEFARSRRDVVLGGLCSYGPDLVRLYAEADVLALPGQNETFGLAVLEALASGLPVAAMGRGGPLDIVTPEVGALARPGDAADFAGKLDEVLTRRPAAGRCRRRAERHYSWDRTFRRLLAVYTDAGAPVRGSGSERPSVKTLPAVPLSGSIPGKFPAVAASPAGGMP